MFYKKSRKLISLN